MTTAATNRFFSQEFYAKDALSYGGSVTVDAQGTYKIAPFTCFQRIINPFKDLFGVPRNTGWVAVHQKLTALQAEIQNPSSPTLQRFKEEIHNEYMKGGNAAWHLREHLMTLNLHVLKCNRAAINAGILLKVINYVRNFFFGCKPLKHHSCTPIDIGIFDKYAIDPAQRLTQQEQQRTKHSFAIYDNFALRNKHLEESMQKLELGVTDKAYVHNGATRLVALYDKTKQKFSLSMDASDLYLFRDCATAARPYQTQPLTVTETKVDGSKVTHTLQATCTYTPASWLPWRSQKWSYQTNAVELIPNHEYTFNPRPSDPLSLTKLSLRASQQGQQDALVSERLARQEQIVDIYDQCHGIILDEKYQRLRVILGAGAIAVDAAIGGITAEYNAKVDRIYAVKGEINAAIETAPSVLVANQRMHAGKARLELLMRELMGRDYSFSFTGQFA